MRVSFDQYWVNFTTFSIRAFSLSILKNLEFTLSKLNFIIYNTPLYNLLYIKTSNFFTTLFKYSIFIPFYSFFILPLSFSVSLSSVSLSQPSTTGHHIHPPSPQPQATTGRKKKEKKPPHPKSQNQRIIQIKESQNHPEQPTPSTQNHPDQPTNPATEIKNPPKSIKTTEIKTHRHQNCKTHSPNHHRNPPRTTV